MKDYKSIPQCTCPASEEWNCPWVVYIREVKCCNFSGVYDSPKQTKKEEEFSGHFVLE